MGVSGVGGVGGVVGVGSAGGVSGVGGVSRITKKLHLRDKKYVQQKVTTNPATDLRARSY